MKGIGKAIFVESCSQIRFLIKFFSGMFETSRDGEAGVSLYCRKVRHNLYLNISEAQTVMYSSFYIGCNNFFVIPLL